MGTNTSFPRERAILLRTSSGLEICAYVPLGFPLHHAHNTPWNLSVCACAELSDSSLSILLSSSRKAGLALVRATKGMASNEGRMSSFSCSMLDTVRVSRACWTFNLLIHSFLTCAVNPPLVKSGSRINHLSNKETPPLAILNVPSSSRASG